MQSDSAPREHDQAPNNDPAPAERHVLDGRVLTIGRSKQADIRLRDGRLSRKHCQLIPIGDGYMVTDLDSQNGTKVNGKEVRKRVLKPGDFLELGGFRLDFIGDSLLVTQGVSLRRARPTVSTEAAASALIETAHPEIPDRTEPTRFEVFGPVKPEMHGPFLPEQYGPVAPAGLTEPAAAAEAPAAAPSEEVTRLAGYLRDLGADEALLAKALAHLGQAPPPAPPKPAPKPTTGTRSISTSTAAIVVEPVAPMVDQPAEPPVPTDALPELPLIAHALAAAAAPAGLVMAPPAGHDPAGSLSDTTRIRVVDRRRVMRRLMTAVRVRGGSIGVAVAVHAALLAILSVIVVAASVLDPGEPAEISLPESFDAAFEQPEPPPEMPPMPDAVRESAEKELSVAVERGSDVSFGDWSKSDGPNLVDADAAAPISAGNARFTDLRSRVRSETKVPALFADRFGERRARALRGHKRVQPAVEAALAWLASQQRDDGSWSAAAHGGQAPYDVGVTALALLAFVGAGEGGRDSRYAGNVARALAALRNVQQDDGWIGARRGKSLYNHLAATQAALEAWHITRRPAARMVATQGLRALEQARVAGQGWRYRADRGDADTALTSWSGSLLAIAARTGDRPDPEALPTAIRWVRRNFDPSTGRIGYQRRGDSGARFKDALARYPSAAAMSGSGAFMLLIAGYPESDETINGALGIVMKRAASAETKDVYAWHWNALALHQIGGKAWQQYAALMEAQLLPLQAGADAGADTGSFADDDPWAAAGGRVYTTAMAALALESHYRYARVKELE
ncbi:MAG: FHA domain-containing protein [Planctomycetota bacterium]